MTEVVYSPKIKPSTWLARRLYFGSPASDKSDRIRKVNFSSMAERYALWAGSRSRSSH